MASPVVIDSTSTMPLYSGPLDSKLIMGSEAYAKYLPANHDDADHRTDDDGDMCCTGGR